MESEVRAGWGTRTPRRIFAAAAVAIAWALGCAPMQRIPLDLEPAPVLVFVDGEPFEPFESGSPAGVELRSDRPHVLFFKKAGHRSEQVVLRSVELEGRPRLAPERVVVQLAPLAPRGRDLQVELDEPDGSNE